MDRAMLLHRGDLDELVRAIDAAASRADWDEVEVLRSGCLEAVELTGRQLWGPAAYAAYRLALGAPAHRAVAALLAGHDRHALGPLTEVVAQHHAWDELVGHLPGGPVNGVVAVERVARGEDLSGDDRAELWHLDVPGRWEPWEGPPPLATYRADEVLAPAPTATTTASWQELTGPPGRERAAPALTAAMQALAAPWTTSVRGRADVVVVDGDAPAAIAALVPGDAHARPVALPDAVAAMTWAGASGGAVTRRRGLAAGRSATWWALRLLTAAGDDLAEHPDDLEFRLEDCAWFQFTDGDETGWRLRIAMTHPAGWAAAIDAEDHHREPGEPADADAHPERGPADDR